MHRFAVGSKQSDARVVHGRRPYARSRRRAGTLVLALATLLFAFVPIDFPARAQVAGDLPLDTSFVEEILVDSRNPDGATSLRRLEAGVHYEFLVRGTYDYGSGDADAECATLGSTDPTYKPDRFSSTFGAHMLDLLVNKVGVTWEPTQSNPDGCNVVGHEYRYLFTPSSTGQVNFAVSDVAHRDNDGVLRVRIFRLDDVPPDGTKVDEFTVAAAARGGRTSSVSLQAGQAYRIVVASRFSFGIEGTTHDAECLRVGESPGQRQDALDDQGLTQDVLLNNAEIDWISPTGITGCNDRDSTYFQEIVPDVAGPVNLRVRDISYNDNFGSIEVEIFEIDSARSTAPSNPAAPLVPSPPPANFVEEVRVDSRSQLPATTVLPLIAGVDYRFVASGTYRYGGGTADAECADLGDVDPTFQRDRFASTLGPHVLDVTFDNVGIEWNPTQPDPDGCNTVDHTYEFFFTPSTTGNGVFDIADSNRRDNDGVITVRIFRDESLPRDGTTIDEFSVPSTARGGVNSNVSLTANTPYRIVIENRFGFGVEGATHDAECLYLVDGVGNRLDRADEEGQGMDALVNGSEVDWVSPVGVTGCNSEDFTYYLEILPPANGPVNIRVRDISHNDNFGSLEVSILDLS